MIRCRARGELPLTVSSVEQEKDRHMAEFHERRRAPRVAVASSPGALPQRCTASTCPSRRDRTALEDQAFIYVCLIPRKKPNVRL